MQFAHTVTWNIMAIFKYLFSTLKIYLFILILFLWLILFLAVQLKYQFLRNNGECRAVALGISKALNRDCHAGLLRKLRGYGITESLFDLILSFLLNSELNVVLIWLASISIYIDVHVGQTLFLIFINHHPDVNSSQIDIYADKNTIFTPVSIGKSATPGKDFQLTWVRKSF